MRKALLLMMFLGLVGIPAFAGSITFLGGYVLPDGDSDVFDQNVRETTFKVSDLNDFGGTFRYDAFLGNYVNIGAGVSFYNSRTTVEDRDFNLSNGQPILRDIRLEIVPLEANIYLLPAGRNLPVIPYVGGGGGLYYWRYEERGDFISNRNTVPIVTTGVAFSDGYDPGFHVEGGVYIPVASGVAIAAEVKYWRAHGDLDVRGFDPSFEPLDLSGKQFSGGVSIWF